MKIPKDLNIFLPYLVGFDDSNRCWIVARSNLGGRGLFATRRIKKGELIFSNKPLILSPRPESETVTYCGYCYRISASCYPCDKCSIILCSEKCETNQNHIRECSYVYDNWKTRQYDNAPKILTNSIIYLRGILLTDEQKIILNILETCDIKTSSYDFDDLCTSYIIPHEQVQFMKRMYGVLRANTFRINSKESNKIPLRGIYPVSSFLNHSCSPNTRNVFRKDYTMAVYATRDIDEGEEIVCCYSGLLWSSPMRRIQLYKSKNFWCTCERCRDPSEMGTNLGALKCVDTTCPAYLLPTSPLDPKSIWKCKKCNSSVTSVKINTVHGILGSLVGAFNVDDWELNDNILQKLKLFVPDCNHILVELRLRMAIALGYPEPHLNELSESRLELKERLCRDTLRTLAALHVGDAHLRGLLLYHLHAALAERARRTPHLYEELKSEIECTIEQAHNILQDDISAPPDLELRRKYLGSGCEKPPQEKFFLISEATK